MPDRAHLERSGRGPRRELVRYRKSLVEERTREVNRVEKVLEGAGVKLAAVASTLTGKGVRDMLRALADGEEDADRLAEMARGRMRSKRAELARALRGAVGPHQRFMLAEQVGHLDELEGRIERVSREVEARLHPAEAQLQALETIPGVGRACRSGRAGRGARRRGRARHGPVPHERALGVVGRRVSAPPRRAGLNESGGKRKSGRTRKGNRHLRSALVEAAHAASRARGTYLAAQYHRLAGRRGRKRAAVAVAHSILVIAYHLLRDGGAYRELGATYFDELKEATVVRRMERRLQSLGYDVALQKKAA